MTANIQYAGQKRHPFKQDPFQDIAQIFLPVALAITAAWVPIFLFFQCVSLAISESILCIVIAVCWLIARRIDFSAAMVATQLVCLAVATFFCLVLDIPSAEVPRIAHAYFLVIALAAYINFKRARSVISLCIIPVSLLGFLIFSSAPMVTPFALPLSDQVRGVTIWINAGTVVALLSFGLLLLQSEFTTQSRLVRDLRLAIQRDELWLALQPQVNEMREIVGAEALLRWSHPRQGEIAPSDFIPIAEEAGLMPEIGTWVIQQAMHILAEWQQRPETSQLTLSINISVDHFLAEDFVSGVVKALADHGVSPARLKLELTETVLAHDMNALVIRLAALRDAGLQVALDDFGTGYSSLSYLQQLPIHQLKIDRSFVQGVPQSPRDAALARNVARLGKDLDLEILAEGIETEQQFQFMLGCGCTQFQGYFFGRPVPLGAFKKQLSPGA